MMKVRKTLDTTQPPILRPLHHLNIALYCAHIAGG